MKIRVERRLRPSRMASWVATIITIIAALLVSALVIWIAGANPWKTYLSMMRGAWENKSEVLVKTIPLILCGLAVALAAASGFWNIGVEGQLVLGGTGAAAVALFLPGLWPTVPGWLIILLMVAGGATAAALWSLLSTAPKVGIGANEILLTLFFNSIGVKLAEYLYFGPWRDPKGRGFPGTALFVKRAWFPRLGTTRIHLGLLFALTFPAIIWFILHRTQWGYKVRVVGESRATARYTGINVARVTIFAMLIASGIAGVVGACIVGGIFHRLYEGLAVGYGYTGILIAWLANLSPWQIMGVSLLMAGLLVGGDQVQMSMGLPASVGFVIQGLVLLFVLAAPFIGRHRLRIERR